MASRGQPVCRKEDCSPFDIGLVYQTICRFSAPEKLRYIQNIWKPDQLFVFPQTCEAGGKLRRFRFEWLVRFPWLVYSKYLDGAFCLPCLCFGMECGKNGNKLNKLFKSPLTFWTTACSRFQSHSVGNTDTTHGNAVIAMADFMDNMTRRAVPIDQQIDQLMQQQINENREKMKSIIKTVIFCGQSNIPLKGRRDDNPDDASLQGIFQALLQFRIDSGDTKLVSIF